MYIYAATNAKSQAIFSTQNTLTKRSISNIPASSLMIHPEYIVSIKISNVHAPAADCSVRSNLYGTTKKIVIAIISPKAIPDKILQLIYPPRNGIIKK